MVSHVVCCVSWFLIMLYVVSYVVCLNYVICCVLSSPDVSSNGVLLCHVEFLMVSHKVSCFLITCTWWAWSSKEPTVQYTVKIRAHQCNMHIEWCNIHTALLHTCTLVYASC